MSKVKKLGEFWWTTHNQKYAVLKILSNFPTSLAKYFFKK